MLNENEIVRFSLFVNDEEKYIIFNPTKSLPKLSNPLVLNPDDRKKTAPSSTNAFNVVAFVVLLIELDI